MTMNAPYALTRFSDQPRPSPAGVNVDSVCGPELVACPRCKAPQFRGHGVQVCIIGGCGQLFIGTREVKHE